MFYPLQTQPTVTHMDPDTSLRPAGRDIASSHVPCYLQRRATTIPPSCYPGPTPPQLSSIMPQTLWRHPPMPFSLHAHPQSSLHPLPPCQLRWISQYLPPSLPPVCSISHPLFLQRHFCTAFHFPCFLPPQPLILPLWPKLWPLATTQRSMTSSPIRLPHSPALINARPTCQAS